MQEGKYFGCKCKRCSDPTELGTYMGSIICSRCHEGLVVPNNPLQEEGVPNSWECEKCNRKFHPRLITTSITQAWSEIEDADNTDSRALEILLKRFSRTFPQSSVVIVEIKQNLVALYRDVILREPSPSRKIMQRKITLCTELLKVLEAIEPGISRLRGKPAVHLHQKQTPLKTDEPFLIRYNSLRTSHAHGSARQPGIRQRRNNCGNSPKSIVRKRNNFKGSSFDVTVRTP